MLCAYRGVGTGVVVSSKSLNQSISEDMRKWRDTGPSNQGPKLPAQGPMASWCFLPPHCITRGSSQKCFSAGGTLLLLFLMTGEVFCIYPLPVKESSLLCFSKISF